MAREHHYGSPGAARSLVHAHNASPQGDPGSAFAPHRRQVHEREYDFSGVYAVPDP
jgi:hypothetical protein